jgi:hypothetical protein
MFGETGLEHWGVQCTLTVVRCCVWRNGTGTLGCAVYNNRSEVLCLEKRDWNIGCTVYSSCSDVLCLEKRDWNSGVCIVQ